MSSLLTNLTYGPKIISVFLHVFVVAMLSLYSIGDDDVPALPTPQAIDLIVEQGVVDDPEPQEDPEEKDAEQVIPDAQMAASNAEAPVVQAEIPDDVEITNEKPVQVNSQPIVVDNQVTPALTPEAAKDLAFVKEDQQSAVFNPNGEALDDQKSATQQRADAGSDSDEQVKPDTQEATTSASSPSTDTNQNDQVLQSNTGDFTVAAQSKPDDAQTDPEQTDTSLADKGQQLTEDDPKPSTSETGEDKINLSDASDDVDAEKVTTPLPKPKPRALAKAFQAELKRQEAAAEKEREQKRKEEAAAKLAAEKLEQARKDKEKLEKELAKLVDVVKPEPKEQEPKEVEPEKPEEPSEADLTNQLNDQLLALLNEEPTTDQGPKQEQGATSLAELDIDVDRISNRITNSWYFPPGLDISTVPSITLVFEMNEDATIKSVRAQNTNRYENDKTYRHVADSAIRAALSDGPMTELLGTPYEFWRSAAISFSPPDYVEN